MCKFQCLLFVIEQSFICYYIICMTVHLKAKFLLAVITNIRTLPLVFLKMFWTSWRKTRDGCFWHYLRKTIYLRSRKVALLQYLLKCALHLSSWRLKCYYNQRNSVGTDREKMLFQEIWSSYESLLKRDHWKKTITVIF